MLRKVALSSARSSSRMSMLASTALQCPSRAKSTDAPSTTTTYFDILDSWWSAKPTTTASGSSSTSLDEAALPYFDSMLISVRDSLGLESWVVLMAFGGLVRLCTLYFSLYGERAAVRMQCALPQLKPAHEDFQRVYYNDNATAMEVQQAATVLKGVRRAIYKEHRTSNVRALAGLAGSPFVLQGFYSVSKLCENGAIDVGTSSFFWCTSLVFPDPLMILPVMSCALTLLNFELTLSSRRTGMQEGVQKNVIWAARGAAICAVSAVAQFRSGVLLYWIGMNLVGLLQPLLVRSTAFKRSFGIPEVPKETEQSSDDLMLRRLTVQAPYLSHLFESDNETNISMVKPVATDAGGISSSSSPRKPLSEGMTLAEKAALRTQQRLDSDGVDGSSSSSGRPLSNGARFASRSQWSRNNASTIREEDMIPDSWKKQ